MAQFLSAELSRAYNDGRRTGVAHVADLGLTYNGKQIHNMIFARYGVICYLDAANDLLAKFDGNPCLDD